MKILSLIVIIVVTFSISLSSQTLDDNLLVHYSWDSTFDDQSHNGFHPFYTSANFVEDRNGNPSNALYFNGINNFIELPDHYYLKPPFPFSFALWIKLANLEPQNTVIFHNNFNEITAAGAWMNVGSSERLAVNFGDGGGFYPSARKTFYTDAHLEAEKWYFVTAVYHTRFDMRIFINGEEQNGFLDGSADDMVYVEGPGNIGRLDANYQIDPYYYKGFMDEFRYWNRRLTNDEVRQLYVEETLSISELNKKNIILYPNPVRDWLIIKSVSSEELSQVKVIDQFGMVHFKTTNIERVFLGNLNKGIYLLLLQTMDGKQYAQKIIKQ